MKYLNIILFCSCSFIDEPIYSIDTELEPYYLMFLKEGEKRGIDKSGRDIFIYFGNIDVMGKSVFRFDNVIEIIINNEEWHRQRINSPLARQLKEMTMFHELGHALLGRDHVQNTMSIMSTGNIEKYANFELYRDQMFDELFK